VNRRYGIWIEYLYRCVGIREGKGENEKGNEGREGEGRGKEKRGEGSLNFP